jgi:periplasmic divalent cation tolerance protein
MKSLAPALITPCIVYITTGSQAEAELISRTLVAERLAACCSVQANVESWYRWEGAIQHDEECLLVCKTSRERFNAVRDRVLELHSYDVPEIIAVPVVEGSQAYLRWLAESVDPSTPVE